MTHPCLRAVGAAIALALATIVPATGQEARPAGQEVRPDAERAREMVFKPELSREQTAQLATLRNKSAACPGQFPTPTIAVSVAGQWLGTGGADTILNYSTVITNVGGVAAPVERQFGLSGALHRPLLLYGVVREGQLLPV